MPPQVLEDMILEWPIHVTHPQPASAALSPPPCVRSSPDEELVHRSPLSGLRFVVALVRVRPIGDQEREPEGIGKSGERGTPTYRG